MEHMKSRRTTWSRRGLLLTGAAGGFGAAGAVGALGALAGCAPTGAPSSAPTSSVTPSAPTPSGSASASAGSGPASGSASASGTPPWSQLAGHLDGRLVLPTDAGYDSLRHTPNPRYDTARPLALAEVASAADVATALAFAADHGVPVALRSGGHCYAGWSAGDGRLVLDCRGLDGLSWDATSVTMGPGRQLAAVYAGVAARGRALPGGSCPTVGLGGLTLGGGVGVLTRAYGLTCDHLTSAQVVLPTGTTVTASADSHPDLFWALRGGGGGHTGVVTAMTFDTVAAPTVVSTYLTWPAAQAAEVIPAWFSWLGGADARLWSTLKLLAGAAHPDGMSVGATVTWVGPASGFDAALAPILATHPSGRYDHTRGYLDAMQAYAGSGAAPEAFAATSDIAYQPLTDASALDTLTSVVADAPHTLHEAGVSIDALGGHVADLAPGATAFVHRRALATVQYTATYPSTGSGSVAATAVAWVEDLRGRMTPSFGDHAYVNYADPALRDPGPAYFGANWARLRQVRSTYDPDGLLTQPQ
jgi:FAD/FMN-containing dehydrogenase